MPAARRGGVARDPGVLLPQPRHLRPTGWRSDRGYSFYPGEGERLLTSLASQHRAEANCSLRLVRRVGGTPLAHGVAEAVTWPLGLSTAGRVWRAGLWSALLLGAQSYMGPSFHF